MSPPPAATDADSVAVVGPTGAGRSLHTALEYSMDVLRTAPSLYSHGDGNTRNGNNVGDLPSLVGFDWGSCAWRHCGAKADAQEAIAELYSNVGMPEPFECRFIIGENVSTLKRNLCGDCKWTFVRGTSPFFFSNDKLIVAHAHHL